MTREKYEEASILLDRIGYYQDMVDLLENSQGRILCSMRTNKEILNSINIREKDPVMQDLIIVVKAKIQSLNEAFLDL